MNLVILLALSFEHSWWKVFQHSSTASKLPNTLPWLRFWTIDLFIEIYIHVLGMSISLRKSWKSWIMHLWRGVAIGKDRNKTSGRGCSGHWGAWHFTAWMTWGMEESNVEWSRWVETQQKKKQKPVHQSGSPVSCILLFALIDKQFTHRTSQCIERAAKAQC